MLKVLDVSNGALNIAAVCGVPFIGAAATVVDGIVRTCEDVKVHKRRTRQLSTRCLQVLGMLSDQASKLEGSELQNIVDQLVPILERIQKRTLRWSSYNSVMTFIKNGDIKEGIELCDSELDTAMTLFSINSTITLHSSQREMHDIMRSQTEEMREMRELLHRALSSNELQNASVDIAEQLMAGGQNDLRQLRKVQERQFGDDIVRSTSPLPQVSDSQLYLELQRDLITLHRETGIPPTIKILDGEVKRLDTIPIAGGTYSDVWLGLWLGEKKVALKALRNIRAADPKAKKRFENEINMWAGLKNDHILPFYGIVTDMGQHIHMVSPWQENGNVLEYVKTHGDSNTRIRLIRGAAQGLAYLHSRKIIHGNMKCANILVTGEGEACICDFGMSKVIEEVTEKSASATLTAGGNARWMAPELIEGSTPTVEADTYSYAMAILELVTGKHPFADCKTTAAVIYEIVVHKRMPSRPEALQYWLSDGLWELLCACWQTDAASRPSMAQVTSYVQAMEEMAFA